jgi:uncharacterized damage-inducible protein DinB
MSGVDTEVDMEKVRNYLEETRQTLIRSIREFPEEQFFTAPAEGCWSAAETFEHVVSVEHRALGRIQAAVQKPADPSRKSAMRGRDEDLFAGVVSRDTRITAPPITRPTGAQNKEQLLAAFEAARESTMRFAEQNDADLRAHFSPHSMFGDLDCYQWLMLIPAHGERHRAQIEECRERLASGV